MKKITCEYCRTKNDEERSRCEACGGPLPEAPEFPLYENGGFSGPHQGGITMSGNVSMQDIQNIKAALKNVGRDIYRIGP